MAKTIVLLSCVAQKLDKAAPAKDLYQSDLFKKSLAYGESLSPSAMYILSAKHHLLPMNKKIEPYDMTLKDMKADERKEWASKVVSQLKSKGHNLEKDKFIILAGNAYNQYIIPELGNYEIPMKGKRIGQQKQWLKNQIKEITTKLTSILYEILKPYRKLPR